jgi:hypothetical protein
MRLSFEHHSTKELVRGRIEEAIGKALDIGGGQISQVQYTWTGDKLDFSFAVMGKTIKGTTDVTDTEIIVDAGMPLMFKPFESKVKSRILGTLTEMFPQS